MINHIDMAFWSKGSQRYLCPKCRQTFSDTFAPLYYRRQVSEEQVRIVLQAHAEGSSLRGISRISGLAYDTAFGIVEVASQKAQMVHNAAEVVGQNPLPDTFREVQGVETDAISADQMWSNARKKQKRCLPSELEMADCWIALSLAQLTPVNSNWSCW